MPRIKMRVAILVENHYQEMEVWYPILRMKEAGALVTVVGRELAQYTSILGYPVQADAAAGAVRAADFDVVIVPSGLAGSAPSPCKALVDFIHAMHGEGKIIGAIGNGTAVLVVAGIAKGRRLTGATSMAEAVSAAGGTHEDRQVVRDGFLITCRQAEGLPEFMAAVLEALSDRRRSGWF